MILDSDLVILIHKFILDREPGVDGMNEGALESALGRIENRRMYAGLGFLIRRTQALEEFMVDVAQGKLNYLDLANIFASLAVPAPDEIN